MTADAFHAPKQRTLLSMVMSYMASGGSLILSSAAQLLTFAILARSLGVNEFSVFVAVTAICNITVHLCGLGGMECLVRRVARDPSMYPVMLGHNIILTAISGVALVLLGVAILPFFFALSPDPSLNLLDMTLMLITNIIFVRIIVLTEQIFIGHSNFVSANMTVVGFAIARTITAALACLAVGVSTVAEWAVWQFACHVLVAAFCIRALAKLGRPKYEIVREELPLGMYFSIPFILRAIRQNADLLTLSLVTTAEIVASYSVARRILESSYLSVEALNRLMYPGSARAATNGLHKAMDRIRKVLFAATGISLAAAATVFLLAPLLPYLFGHEYLTLVSFVRNLCWVVIPLGMWSIAVEALGAAGYHAARASVMGLGSILGAALAAWATWYAPPMGTVVSFYVIEISMVAVAWTVFFRYAKKDELKDNTGAALI